MSTIDNILLPVWKAWDGSGVYDVPARNVHFVDGRRGCILISTEGVSVYHTSVELLNTDERYDEGIKFLDTAEKPEDFHKLNHLLSKQIIAEAIEMFSRYMKTQNN